MINFQLNKDNSNSNSGFNDIYLDSTGQIALTKGFECLEQAINSIVWLFIGEYAFNKKIGIPYKKILGKSINNGLISYYLNNQIINLNNYMSKENIKIYKIKQVVVTNLILDKITGMMKAYTTVQLTNGKQLKMELNNAFYS